MILTVSFGKIFIIFVVIVVAIALFFSILHYRYKQFLMEHSISINKLRKVNDKFTFNKIELLNYSECYDNKIYYDKLEPKDLLIYNLVKDKIKVRENISKVIDNINKYDLYIYEVKNAKKFGDFDIQENVIFKNMLLYFEKTIFNSLIKKPIIKYSIKSTLILTNINGVRLGRCWDVFDIDEVEELLAKVANKTNDRYNDKDIWDSICKIERAKVTNKLRFYIYNRDGHRCCKCGRHTKDLEIDHIMPISKGGKTHPDNLQTLCKRCNMEKSNNIEAGTVLFNDKVNRVCPKCGAPLKMINGKYGIFYGCMNYPNCKYTEK